MNSKDLKYLIPEALVLDASNLQLLIEAVCISLHPLEYPLLLSNLLIDPLLISLHHILLDQGVAAIVASLLPIGECDRPQLRVQVEVVPLQR